MLTIFFEIAFMIMFSATIAGGFIVKKYNKYIPVIFVAVACAVLGAISYILDLPIERETSYMISIALMLLLSVAIVAVSFVLFKKSNNQNNATLTDTKSKSIKNFIIPFLVALAFVPVIGFLTFDSSLDIDDINGENDYSLNKITLEEILDVSVTTSQYLSSISCDGEKSSVTGIFEDCDYNTVRYRAKKISGTLVLNSTKIDGKSFSINVENTVVSGNCRIIVSVDGEYYDEFPLNDEYTMLLENIENKEVLVIVAGESADCEIELKRNI